MKKNVQSCRNFGLFGLAFQNNSSNCLVLIPHRQLENLDYREIFTFFVFP